jgi:hypothetical protein
MCRDYAYACAVSFERLSLPQSGTNIVLDYVVSHNITADADDQEIARLNFDHAPTLINMVQPLHVGLKLKLDKALVDSMAACCTI